MGCAQGDDWDILGKAIKLQTLMCTVYELWVRKNCLWCCDRKVVSQLIGCRGRVHTTQQTHKSVSLTKAHNET